MQACLPDDLTLGRRGILRERRSSRGKWALQVEGWQVWKVRVGQCVAGVGLNEGREDGEHQGMSLRGEGQGY